VWFPPRLGLLVERDEPVIVDGREMVRYSVITREDILPSGVVRGSVEDVLSLAGAWSDLDWDEMVVALDRIRHVGSVASHAGEHARCGARGML
jgi:hypothetical protein